MMRIQRRVKTAPQMMQDPLLTRCPQLNPAYQGKNVLCRSLSQNRPKFFHLTPEARQHGDRKRR